MDEPRYRCDGCGNLTRFDVTTSQTTKAFHHYTVGGELEVEDATVLSHHVDEVVCRWCGHGRSVVEVGEGETGAGETGAVGVGAAAATGPGEDTGSGGNTGSGTDKGSDREREPGAQSRTS